MGKSKHTTRYAVVDGKTVKIVDAEPHEHSGRHHKHSSSSGRHHHSSHSYSSQYERSHSTHHREGGSGSHFNSIPQPPPANYYYTNPNSTMGYTSNEYYYPAASFGNQHYQYGQRPRLVRREIEEVTYIRPRSVPRYYGESYEPSGTAYCPSERVASTWGPGYEASYSTTPQPQPRNVPEESAYSIPYPIQNAIAKGEAATTILRDTIRVVLLHEWCMRGNKVYPPSRDFQTAIKVIPVRRDKYGAFQPIESNEEWEWGVKTGYHPEHDTYLSTILIRVPSELHDVNDAMVKAAYKRFFAEARNDLLEDVLEIPFKNNQDYRKYGMLFVFEEGSKRGSKPPRLFDDYLCEDAIIRLQT